MKTTSPNQIFPFPWISFISISLTHIYYIISSLQAPDIGSGVPSTHEILGSSDGSKTP